MVAFFCRFWKNDKKLPPWALNDKKLPPWALNDRKKVPWAVVYQNDGLRWISPIVAGHPYINDGTSCQSGFSQSEHYVYCNKLATGHDSQSNWCPYGQNSLSSNNYARHGGFEHGICCDGNTRGRSPQSWCHATLHSGKKHQSSEGVCGAKPHDFFIYFFPVKIT